MADERISPVEEVQLLRAAACDWRLSRGDLGAFAVILRHCNAERRSFPGPTLIAKEARLSVTNIKASILKLERCKYVAIERPGRRKPNRYLVLGSPVCPSRDTRKPSWLGSAVARAALAEAVSSLASIPSAANRTGDAGMRLTSHVGMSSQGMPARQEVAFKSPSEITGAPRHLDKQESEQQQEIEQQIPDSERERAESRESTRAEYLEACETHPEHAARMARLFPHLLADLINESRHVA